VSFVELVSVISMESKLPKEEVAKLLRAFSVQVRRVAMSGERVVLPGLGTFYMKALKSRTLFGGDVVTVPRKSLKFRESRRSKWKS
jgi:nucleoid DNA-binding protein